MENVYEIDVHECDVIHDILEYFVSLTFPRTYVHIPYGYHGNGTYVACTYICTHCYTHQLCNGCVHLW